MTKKREIKKLEMKKLRFLTSLAPVALLAGCMSAPTYGTGTRSDVQLLEDVSNIFALGPQDVERIEYQPRPDLVQPRTTDALPAPQASVIQQAGGAWPESPEQRRARLRAEATANQDNPLYRSSIVNTGLGQVNNAEQLTPAQQRERFRAGRAIQSGGYAERRFLSDPPTEYKQLSETADITDLGEPERVKERRRLKEARAQSGKSGLGGLRSLLPF